MSSLLSLFKGSFTVGDLSHFDARGRGRMVDVSGKDSTLREADSARRNRYGTGNTGPYHETER